MMKPRTAAQRLWMRVNSPQRTTAEEQVEHALDSLAHRRSYILKKLSPLDGKKST
jgi:hypothetical protein